MSKWPTLSKPPVVLAIFQLKYKSQGIKLDDFLRFDVQLKHNLPNRNDNINVGIDVEGSTIQLGISKISATSDAKIGSYVYFTNDQKIKLEISENTITFIDERPYKDWSFFKKSALDTIFVLSDLLKKTEITRTSIRFINRFSFDNFDNPLEYFNTLITSNDKDLPFPLVQYGFRLIMDIPNSDIHSIVNQNVEILRANSFAYTFDIDVLDQQNLLFDVETLSMSMEYLRNIKNEIFFNNITEKTKNSCN